MPPEHRPLRLIDTETGELHSGDCPNCAEMLDQVAGLERDVRTWRLRCIKAERDKEAQAHKHKLWPEALELFRYWQIRCKHPKAHWTIDRFEAVEPMLREYGTAACRRAIDGAAFQPRTKKRKNGTWERFDDFGLIFRSAGHLESFANRAPRAK